MHSCRRYLRRHSLAGRRLVTVVALVAYLLSVCGFPLPHFRGEEVAAAFPCQGHGCCCQTAEQCWSQCCCTTRSQQIAWAHEHNVTVPYEVQIAAELAVEPKACCLKHQAGSAVDSHQDHDEHCVVSHAESSKREITFSWAGAFQARKCQGLPTLWVSAGANLPLAIEPLWAFAWTPAGEICLANTSLLSRADLPSVPPPRA